MTWQSFTIQLTSTIALIGAVISTGLIAWALSKLSPSYVRNMVIILLLSLIVTTAGLAAMTMNHFKAVSYALDIWHGGGLVALILEVGLVFYIVRMVRKLKF